MRDDVAAAVKALQDRKMVAQIAVEAIVDNPVAYDRATMVMAMRVAQEAGVAEFYLEFLDKAIHAKANQEVGL